MKTRNMVLLAAAVIGVIVGGAVAARRWGLPARRPSGGVDWRPMTDGPIPRFEQASAVVRGKLYVFGGFWNGALEASSAVEVWDPVSGSWSRRHDMPSQVTHRNAVPVGDTIWFAGGFVGTSPGPATREVWAYDTQRDTWHPGPPLPEPRAGGVMVMADSALHYFGGYGPDRQTTQSAVWRLDLRQPDLAAAVWDTLAPLPRPRGHTSGAAIGSHIYVVGGTVRHDPVQVDLASFDRYDLETNTWETMPDLPFPRSHTEASTFVADGRLYVAGGRSHPTGRQSVGDMVVFDPTVGSWLFDRRLPLGLIAPVALPIGDTLVLGLGATEGLVIRTSSFWTSSLPWGWRAGTPSPVPVGEVSAALIGRRLFLIGETADSTTPVYDIGTDSWEILRSRRPALGHHTTAEVANGQLYLFGGLEQGGGIVQIFDPARGEWRFGADVPFRAGSSASTTIGGMIYVGGGIHRGHTIADAARYDPGADQWTPIAPMPLPRNHAASGTDGRRWYLFGGRGPGSGDNNTVANGFAEVQVYDPGQDQWIVSGRDPSAPPPLPQGRGGMGRAVFVNGEFWVIGGETEDGPGATAAGVYGRIDIFNPTTNSWRRGPDLKTPRHGIFPVAVGNRIYVAGGGIKRGLSASGVIEIFDAAHFPPR